MVVVVVEELSQVGFQMTQVVVVGVSTEAEDQPEVGFEVVGQLSSLPAEACLSLAMASQAEAPPPGVSEMAAVAAGFAELGQELVKKQCFPHSLKKKSHCWSHYPFC